MKSKHPRNHFLLTRRQMMFGCGAGLFGSLAWAHDHALSTSNGSPYMVLSKGACEETGLRCASSVTPLFAKNGKLWIVWSGGGGVWISQSQDLGKKFSPPKEIAHHGEYLDVGPDARPQIVQCKDGRILIAYGYFHDDQWNARINLISSIDDGLTFTEPRALSFSSISQRFPNLLVTPNGHIFATWVDKRLVTEDARKNIKREGASIAWAWSTDGGQTFGTERIAQSNSCECCRIAVATNAQGLPVLMYRALFKGDVRDHATQVFTEMNSPGLAQRVSNDNWISHACPHHGPALTISCSGKLHTAWFTQGTQRNGVFYANSTDDGLHYSVPMRIGSSDKLVGRPQLLAIGRKIWIVWKEFDGKSTTIGLQQSIDDGKTWSNAMLLANTQGYSDHPLLLAFQQRPYLSWLTHESGYKLTEIPA